MNRKDIEVLARVSVLTLSIVCFFSYERRLCAQVPERESSSGKDAKIPSSGPELSMQQKIALAMSAGPVQVAKNATIVEMPRMTGQKPKELRPGSNGWTCYAIVNQPMCLDQEWQKWIAAWVGKSNPNIEKPGIAYMLRGDGGASNTDPYAMAPTATNEWVVSPAHLMLLLPDPKSLDVYPADPKSGGPWVMWKGTPYAHLMVPVSPTEAAVMRSK